MKPHVAATASTMAAKLFASTMTTSLCLCRYKAPCIKNLDGNVVGVVFGCKYSRRNHPRRMAFAKHIAIPAPMTVLKKLMTSFVIHFPSCIVAPK
jgi:hypothetical protein